MSDIGAAMVLLAWPVGIVHVVLVNPDRLRLVMSHP
jgi:hypothetical protein